MDEMEKQKNANIQYDGWQKFKSTQDPENISKELDAAMESQMWEANGIKILKEPTQSEKVQIQAEMIAEHLRHDPGYIEINAKLMAQQERAKKEEKTTGNKRGFKFYVKAALIVSGLTAMVLCKKEIGGMVHDAIVKVVEWDNKKLDEEFEQQKAFVEEMTGKTVHEIMNNDDEEKTNGHSY